MAKDVNIFMYDSPTTSTMGRALKPEEDAMLDQLLGHLSGGSPVLQSYVFSKKDDVRTILELIVKTENQPFTGMRKAGNSVGGVVLAPKHVDTNLLDWQFNPYTLAAAGWTTRSNGAGTRKCSQVTIARHLWLVILGIQIDYDITNIIGTAYAKRPSAFRYVVNGNNTLQIDMHSAGAIEGNNTQLIPVPTQYISETSIFTEEAYYPAAVTTNTYKHYVRQFGIVLGTGSVLWNVY